MSEKKPKKRKLVPRDPDLAREQKVEQAEQREKEDEKRKAKQKYIEYTPELGVRICERVAMREPLTTICRDPDMPNEVSIYRWRRAHVEFAEAFEDARRWRAESRADRIDDYLRRLERGELDANAAKVLIEGERWQASKELPARYGDKVQAEISGKDGGSILIEDMTPDHKLKLARSIALILTTADKSLPQSDLLELPNGAFSSLLNDPLAS